MTDVIGAFFWGEEAEGAADKIPERVDGSGFGLPQEFLEFGEGHLDRIEIRAIGRQEQKAPLAGKACKKRFRLSMTIRGMADGACTDVRPGVTTRHRGGRPSLVEKNQPAAEALLRVPPGLPALSDVGTRLFAGVHGFF